VSAARHEGECFCGAVALTVTGDAVGQGYCHCASCRSWSAGPVNAFTLWKPEQLAITRGAEHLGEFHKTARSERHFCKRCGGHVFTKHPEWNLVDVYAATLRGFAFAPGVHVNYAETVLRIKDGLPKMRDFPAEMGGSGETLPE
jgi:hypothetical protein